MSKGKTRAHPSLGMQAWASLFFVGLGILVAPVRIAVLTRALSQEHYGLFSVLSLTATSLGFVALLGLRNFLIVGLPGKTGREQGSYLNSGLCVTVLAAVVVAVLFVAAGRWLPLLNSSYSMTLILVATAIIPSYALANLGLAYLLAVGRIIRYRALSFLVSNLWMCIAVVVVVLLRMVLHRPFGIDQVAWIWLGGTVIALFLVVRATLHKLADNIASPPSLRLMKEGVIHGAPLLPRYFALALFRLADRFVILREMGPESVAVYTVAATLVFFAAETQTFLDYIYPDLSKAWRENLQDGLPGFAGGASRHIHTALRVALLCTVPLAIGIVLWGWAAVELLAGHAYAESSVVFPIMAPLVPLMPITMILQFVVTLDEKTLRVGNTILAAAVLNLFMNMMMVPILGIAGAAAATTFSYALLFLVTVFMSRLGPHISFRQLRVLPLFLSGMAMGGVPLGMRWAFHGFSFWEIPVACPVFLAVGNLTGLWSVAELHASLRHRKPADARPE